MFMRARASPSIYSLITPTFISRLARIILRGVVGNDVIFRQNKQRHRVGRTREHLHGDFQHDRRTSIFDVAGEKGAWSAMTSF